MKPLILAALLLLVAASAEAITLTWKPPTSANQDGYTIEKRDIGATDWSLLNKVGNVTTYLDPAPVPWGRCYRVKAFNLIGVGVPSNEVCVPSSVPGAAVLLPLSNP